MKIFLLFIGVICAVIGVIFIYDARPIVKQYFSISDKNVGVKGLKIFGFILITIGGIILYYNL